MDDDDDYNDDVDEDEDDDDSSDKGNESDCNQGVQRSRRRGKGITKKYADYSQLMAARRARRGGQRRALIRNGFVFFSSDDVTNAKLIPEEDREEFALGVALVHYSMNAGIKSLKQRAKQE